jgi:hypothetical protein
VKTLVCSYNGRVLVHINDVSHVTPLFKRLYSTCCVACSNVMMACIIQSHHLLFSQALLDIFNLFTAVAVFLHLNYMRSHMPVHLLLVRVGIFLYMQYWTKMLIGTPQEIHFIYLGNQKIYCIF